MALTGTQLPQGTQVAPEGIYLEGGPRIYFEDQRGNYRFNPDSDGFYHGLSGSATYPVYEVGCFQDFHLVDNVELNDIRCDNLGVVATVQHRNFIDITFTLMSMFPLAILAKMLKGGGAVVNNQTDKAEKFGLGPISNNQYWKVWAPLVYDTVNASYVAVTLHKASFVDAFDWNWRYGDAHQMGLTLRGYADSSKPDAQRFATVVRVDTVNL